MCKHFNWETGRYTEGKRGFVNSVLIANTSTPPFDGSKTTVKLIDEVKYLPFSRSTSYKIELCKDNQEGIDK